MPADRFSSLAALKEHLGKNGYRIRCLNRRARVTVISPHGGFIEAGTSAIARAVAGRSHNLFDFQGLLQTDLHEMHVTATHFRDPELSKMLSNSDTAVAIHGMLSQGHKTIYLGGLNKQLKSIIHEHLLQAAFQVDPDAPRWRGEHPKNVVNLACHYGVQLEFSDEFLADLFVAKRFLRNGRNPRRTARFHDLVKALRTSISIYMKLPQSNNCQNAEPVS
jgi:phage replication-related protein YjqB (UPF0714/DUF867 family)